MRRGISLLRGVLCLLWLPLALAAPPAQTLRLIAFNDFHGHLSPEVSENGAPRGGILAFAETVQRLRAEAPASVLVSAGDLFGAAPLASSLLADEPTITLMNALQPDLNVLGNHEFDSGQQELARKMQGGCQQYGAARPCQLGAFAGATFPMLSANVLRADGTPRYQPYWMVQRAGLKVAFIGATTTDTPGLSRPSAMAGLHFAPEAQEINRWARQLQQREHPDLLVAVIHEGGTVDADDHDPACPSMRGRLPEILAALDPAIKVVLSAHTHQLYRCERDGRLVTSAGSYGRYLTRIDLRFDPQAHTLLGWQAENLAVTTSGAAAPLAIRQGYQRVADYTREAVERPVAPLSAPIANRPGADGEVPLGRVVADAYVASMRAQGAEIGLTNPGGLRASLVPQNGQLRFGQLLTALPFMGRVVLLDMTGRQIEQMLAEQFRRNGNLLLPVSAGISYRYDAHGIEAGSLRILGAPVVPTQHYRVATNDFLAGGGDGFVSLGQVPRLGEGPLDHEALAAWLASQPVMDTQPRTVRLPGG